MKFHRVFVSFAAGLFAVVALPAHTVAAERAELDFADLGGIENWRAAEDGDALLIEGRNDQWYRATFWGPCPEINFAQTLGFVTSRPTGNLDRFSSILVDGVRCNFRTFERTSPPDADSGLAQPERE